MGAAGKDSGCNSMRVGLIDVDGHNFPNIPLMKLSAWHKQQGDTVGFQFYTRLSVFCGCG